MGQVSWCLVDSQQLPLINKRQSGRRSLSWGLNPKMLGVRTQGSYHTQAEPQERVRHSTPKPGLCSGTRPGCGGGHRGDGQSPAFKQQLPAQEPCGCLPGTATSGVRPGSSGRRPAGAPGCPAWPTGAGCSAPPWPSAGPLWAPLGPCSLRRQGDAVGVGSSLVARGARQCLRAVDTTTALGSCLAPQAKATGKPHASSHSITTPSRTTPRPCCEGRGGGGSGDGMAVVTSWAVWGMPGIDLPTVCTVVVSLQSCLTCWQNPQTQWGHGHHSKKGWHLLGVS